MNKKEIKKGVDRQ